MSSREAPRSGPDLLPAALRHEVIDAAGWYVLAEIGKLFRSEGFELPADFAPEQGRMRMSTAVAFTDQVNFASIDHVDRYLRVVERLLDRLELTLSDQGAGHWAADRIRLIRRELARAEVDVAADGRLVLSRHVLAAGGLSSAPTWSGIHLAMKRLERSDTEPEERLGAAKELVEATIKHALTDLSEPFDHDADVPALAKQLHKRLKLDPAGVAPTARGVETIVRILGGLTMIPQGLAELRNEGYGTGHGQAQRIAGLRPRHADLAARSAVAYAGFIMDTLTAEDAPWRHDPRA